MTFCSNIARPYLSAWWKSGCQVAFVAKRSLASKSGPTDLPEQPNAPQQAAKADDSQPGQMGWFSRMLVRNIDTGHEQHSSQLSDKDTVYEMQFHSVKPEYMEQYTKEFQKFIEMISKWKTGAELSASWTVEVGDLDEAVHLWKFEDGYPGLDKHKSILRQNEDFIAFRRRRNMMLRSRKNQILLAFSFWPEIAARAGPNIYELRSYTLRPGTMIEWGNCWVKGLKYRRAKNEAVAGYFSHIGELYQVHHLWAFESLQDRKEVREAAWSRPGWDECVAKTVPLMRHMMSRVLIPLPFSPLK